MGEDQEESWNQWLQAFTAPGLLVLLFMFITRSLLDDGSERKILSWPFLSEPFLSGTRWDAVLTLVWLTVGCSEFLARDDGLDVARVFGFTGVGFLFLIPLLENQISPILKRLGVLILSACLLPAAVLGWQEGYILLPVIVGLGGFLFLLSSVFDWGSSSDSSEDEDE